jgi:hypothetical protein
MTMLDFEEIIEVGDVNEMKERIINLIRECHADPQFAGYTLEVEVPEIFHYDLCPEISVNMIKVFEKIPGCPK